MTMKLIQVIVVQGGVVDSDLDTWGGSDPDFFLLGLVLVQGSDKNGSGSRTGFNVIRPE